MIATKTNHKPECARVFNRYDLSCARCLELKGGAKARAGWGDWKREQEARQLRWIKAHDCKASRCMVVCTFGDW